MIREFPIGSTLEVTHPALGTERARRFREVTHSIHCSSTVPTLATVFREAEFQWLDRLQVDWHRLLHAEQRYDYHAPLPLDEPYQIRSTLKSVRTRKSSSQTMTFVELETQVLANVLCITATTNFVVREPV